MKKYELLFILLPTVTEDQKKEHLASVEAMVKKFDGKVVNKNDWGKRPLGYAIQKAREGFCFLWDFEADPSKVGGLRNALQLNQDIIKYTLTVKNLRLEEQLKTAPKRPIEEPAVQH